MASGSVCPICGGIVDGSSADGGQRCTCAKNQAPATSPAPAPSTRKKKVCCSCGKDLAGHRRFRDSLGYWCKECHHLDRLRKLEVRCEDCGRLFLPHKLIEFDGALRCATCERARQRAVLAKLRKEGAKHRYRWAEREQLKWLVMILLILVLIILLAKIGLR